MVQEVELPIGRLSIGPIEADEVDALAVLVTRAFAGTPEVVSFPTIRYGSLVPRSHGRMTCLCFVSPLHSSTVIETGTRGEWKWMII